MTSEEYHKITEFLKKLDKENVKYLIQFYHFPKHGSSCYTSDSKFVLDNESKYYRLVMISDRIRYKEEINVYDMLLEIDPWFPEYRKDANHDIILYKDVPEFVPDNKFIYRVDEIINFSTLLKYI